MDGGLDLFTELFWWIAQWSAGFAKKIMTSLIQSVIKFNKTGQGTANKSNVASDVVIVQRAPLSSLDGMQKIWSIKNWRRRGSFG